MDVKKVSEYFPSGYPCLDINNPKLDNCNAIIFQVCGNLSFASNTGLQYSDAQLGGKALAFVHIAKKTNASLALTPEGSIEVALIDKIITNESLWPSLGKLWCLCATGIPDAEFDPLISRYMAIPSVTIHCSDIRTRKEHINSLWYLFKISNNELCVIVQLKTAAMRDENHMTEDLGLSTGGTVFLFDLIDKGTHGQLFASLICADAIGSSISNLLNAASSNSLFLFNPQFNAKPRASSFQVFRTSFFGEKNIVEPKMIVLNWGEESSINKNAIVISDGTGSAVITSSNRSNFHNETLNKNRKRNGTQGLYFFYDDDRHIDFWKLQNKEVVTKIMVKNACTYGIEKHLFTEFSVLVENVYYFNNTTNNWDEHKKADCDLPFNDESMSSRMHPLPYPCLRNEDDCCIMNGCNLVYCDYFFALCFGDCEKDQISMEKEVGKKITIALDRDSILKQRKATFLYKQLVKLLEQNVFPESLKNHFQECVFEIETNAAETGSNQIYNIRPASGATHKKGIVSILDSVLVEEVETLYKRLYSATNKEYKDQIVVYFRDNDSNAFIPFSSPHTQSSFMNSKLTQNPTSYKNAR